MNKPETNDSGTTAKAATEVAEHLKEAGQAAADAALQATHAAADVVTGVAGKALKGFGGILHGIADKIGGKDEK